MTFTESGATGVDLTSYFPGKSIFLGEEAFNFNNYFYFTATDNTGPETEHMLIRTNDGSSFEIVDSVILSGTAFPSFSESAEQGSGRKSWIIVNNKLYYKRYNESYN